MKMNPLSQILFSMGIRLDDKYTAALEKQLEFVKSRTYDVKYPELKARQLLPIDNSVDPGAETMAYEQWDEYGMAEVIANYADDLGLVDVLAQRFVSPIVSIGKGYQYSVQDLRRAAMAGNNLDARRAGAARRAIERRLDEIAAFGDSKSKLLGFLNHPNVPSYTAATDGTSTRWVQGRGTPKAAQLIQKDMHVLVQNVRSLTKEVHTPNVLLLSTFEFGYLAQTPVDTTNQTTILRAFLANSPFVQNIDSWYKLDQAAAGSLPRMVAYQRDPEVIEFVIPQEFEQLPPQARNLAFVVPCHARVGGVKFYYPLSAAYMDGI
jgi:hypothetical protein